MLFFFFREKTFWYRVSFLKVNIININRKFHIITSVMVFGKIAVKLRTQIKTNNELALSCGNINDA
jgi:hypothetical protein